MARFKYLREEFALDALVDYGTEPAYAGRDVPNPERQRLNAEIRQAHTHLEQLQAHYGLAALENRERLRPTMRGFKIANAALSARLREAMRRITALETQRATVPARVPVQEVVAADVVKLSVERKHLTDLLKMLAYQAEGDLGSSSPPTPPHRAGVAFRALIQTALAAVCHELNAAATRFPGTQLRMRASPSNPNRPEASPSQALATPRAGINRTFWSRGRSGGLESPSPEPGLRSLRTRNGWDLGKLK